MSELKRTQLYDVHVAAGATMVDFGGWEMPIQYPSGIIAEHLYTRQVCGLFDVSHMGRLLIEGPQRKEFLQHVLTSNVSALDLNMAQYCIIPNENGCAVDDAYLYLFQEDSYLLVVNAANIDKDLEHLNRALSGFDCTITNISAEWASIAVQGPKSKEMLMTLTGGESPTKEPTKNSLGTVSLEGHQARIAKTGYTGEPLGYEVYVRSEDVVWLWNRLVELGARPAGLGARDTLRMEASFPLYGHEMGTAPDGTEIPIFAVPLAKFAVSFSQQKGDFIGRAALERQHRAFVRYMDRDFSDMSALPRRIAPIALLDRGVMRAGMEIYRGDKLVGWVTSGTMVPYFKTQGEGLSTVILEASGKRAIGLLLAVQRRSGGRHRGGGYPGQAAQGRDPRPAHERGRASLRPSPAVRRAGGGPHRGRRRPHRQGPDPAAQGHREPRLAAGAVREPDPLGEHPQPGRAPAVRQRPGLPLCRAQEDPGLL